MLEVCQTLRSLQRICYSLDNWERDVRNVQTATSAEVPFYASGDHDDAPWKRGNDVPMLCRQALTGLNSWLTDSITRVVGLASSKGPVHRVTSVTMLNEGMDIKSRKDSRNPGCLDKSQGSAIARIWGLFYA